MTAIPTITHYCIWCEAKQQAHRTRMHDDAVEWQCANCEQRYILKDGFPDNVFFFFPPDLYAAVNPNIKERDPGFLDAKPSLNGFQTVVVAIALAVVGVTCLVLWLLW
jgi:hypothetical protein